MYKLIVFDIDGTLLDTEVAVLKGLKKCLNDHHNINVELKDLEFAIGMPGDEVFANFGINDDGFSYSKWIKYVDDFRDEINLFNGIEETLQCLKNKNITLGIATSKTRYEYDTTVKSFGINDYFDHVVCIDEVSNPKPHGEPLLKILNEANLSNNEALFLGDTSFDIECARNADIDFGLALWGAHEKCKEMCNKYFSTPEEICELLAK
ncbi:MAG: HAD family hydrolase [Terrisporobacter sp.]